MIKKKIYVVKGCGDGNIGVYDNKKGAYEKVFSYLQNGFEKKIKIESYTTFCANFDEKQHFHIVSFEDSYVDIQEFILNK